MKRDAEKYEVLKREIYEATVRLGGTITGEHGVGKIRVKELYRFTHPKSIELMKGIKRLFDPNNILNPYTVLEV
jgi:glycolate oxidase